MRLHPHFTNVFISLVLLHIHYLLDEATMTNFHWYGKLDLNSLAKEFGSPLWIVGEKQITHNVFQFGCFTGHPSRILFPVKCNPAPAVLEIISNTGCGADCANLQEINLALLAGIPWSRIAYNSPFQDYNTARIVLENGGILVCDDRQLINNLEENPPTINGQIWLRINPELRSGYLNSDENTALMSHGEGSSKFGIPEEEIPRLLESLKLPVTGIHLHVGTQMDNLQSFVTAMNALHRVADLLIDAGHNVRHLDVGGGLGIAFTEEDDFPHLHQWVRIMNSIKKTGFEYYAEPGHALVGNAVGLLVTVNTLKPSRGRVWAVCDAGTDLLAKVTLLKWPHRVLKSDGQFLPMKGNDALAGPLCFAGDTLLHTTDLTGVQVGDNLLITHAGAYTHALSNSFNGRTAPSWIVIGNNIKHTTLVETNFSRNLLQYHRWNVPDNQVASELSEETIQALLSPYLHKQIQNDSYEVISIRNAGSHHYQATVDIHSEAGFVSMPTAIRVIGNLCIVAILHKHGLKAKDRPVMGKKMQMEYFGFFPTGTAELNIYLSHEIKKEGQHWSMLATFETRDGSCKGDFVINA